jgi:hypothetical protein
MHGAGSLASVVTSYFRTPDFLNLSASSQATYRKVLNPILQKHGHRYCATCRATRAMQIIIDMGEKRPRHGQLVTGANFRAGGVKGSKM